MVALFVHSLSYSGFFEDPLTWFVLAVAASFLVVRPRADEHVTERARRVRVWPSSAVLGALVAVAVPTLGSDPWPFLQASVRRRTACSARSSAAPTVSGTSARPDAGALFAALLVAVAALVAGWRRRPLAREGLVALLTAVVSC